MKKIIIILLFLCIASQAFGYAPYKRDILADIKPADSKDYEFTVRDTYTNVILDLTGLVVKFEVKRYADDLSLKIDKTFTIIAPTTGVITLTLSVTDTALPIADYVAYIILTNAGGTLHKTMLESKLTLSN